jgi:hypothetical protein
MLNLKDEKQIKLTLILLGTQQLVVKKAISHYGIVQVEVKSQNYIF